VGKSRVSKPWVLGTQEVVPASRRRPFRSVVLVGAVFALAVPLGCSPTSSESPLGSVAIIGDSLAQETEPYLRLLLDPTPLVNNSFGGTAPCDWLDKDLKVDDSSIAVISFTGNSATPCMADVAGQFPEGQALLDRYRADLGALVAKVLATGAKVLLVGQPQRPDPDGEAEVDGINAILLDLDKQDSVSFVDAGAAVENADGSLAKSLPCLAGEAACGADGFNVVRTDDGVHFCPGAGDNPCPVYSSGAFRFAAAISIAIDEL